MYYYNNINLQEGTKLNMGLAALGSSMGLAALGINIKNIYTAKKMLKILENDPKESIKMYKNANPNMDFETWREQTIKTIKKMLVWSKIGTGLSALHIGGSIYLGKKYYDMDKNLKENYKYDMMNAYLEGYYIALNHF